MDAKGEIPLPFSWDKHNFNPQDITGNLDWDKNYKPKLLGKKKARVDKDQRPVNKKGWLIDQEGNVVDRHGKLKFLWR